MKSIYFIIILAVSAFLFITVSTAQQDQQEKTTKKTTKKTTTTTTVQESKGDQDKSMQDDQNVKHKSSKKKSSKKHSTTNAKDETGAVERSDKTGRDETGSTDRSMQDDKTAQQGTAVGNRTGRVIFETNKCNSCHEMKAENIKKTGKSNAPDLSAMSVDRDANWIQKFLKKDETLNGKKHPISFKGNDTELKTLATWLASHNEEKK